MANAVEKAILQRLLPTITKIRYAELASTVIILYDHLLTLDQEIHLIWRSQWSLGKVLFMTNRYYALCIVIYNNYVLFNSDLLTDEVCNHWFRWQGATGVITFIIAELILQLRLYALYFRDKRVLAVTTFVSLAAAASSAYVMGHALTLITSYAIKLPHNGSTVCVPFGLPDNFYAFWIPMLISESVLCGLALFRGFKSYRPTSGMLRTGRRIVEILVRDSVYYFVIIFATYLTNAIIFLTRPDAEVEIPIGFAVALSCVMSSRLCLNVRGYIRDDDPTLPGAASFSQSPHDHLAFAQYQSTQQLSTAESLQHIYAYDEYTKPPGMGEGGGDSDRPDVYYCEDEVLAADGVTVTRSASKIVRGGARLGSVEMRELRVMRAESPRHVRMFAALGKTRSAGAEEVIVI